MVLSAASYLIQQPPENEVNGKGLSMKHSFPSC